MRWRVTFVDELRSVVGVKRTSNTNVTHGNIVRLPCEINWTNILITAVLLRSLMDLSTSIHSAGRQSIVEVVYRDLAHLLVVYDDLTLPTYSSKMTSTHL